MSEETHVRPRRDTSIGAGRELAGLIGLALTILLASYVGAYLVMVKPQPSREEPLYVIGSVPEAVGTDWWASQQRRQTFFFPINRFDRLIRPHSWGPL